MKKKIKMIKWFQLLLLLILLPFIQLSNPKVLATNETRLLLDNRDITEIAEPIIRNNRTLVPIRFIAEELDAQVEWNGENMTVTVLKDNKTVILKLNSHLVIYENGNDKRTYELCDVPPIAINERTYVPLRLVSNALGIGVEWNSESNTIEMDSNEKANIAPFFDVNISSISDGHIVTGKTILQIDELSTEIKNAKEIKYLLIDPNTAKGVVIARGENLTEQYTWIPSLKDSGEKVLVAAIYGEDGKFIAGDSISVNLQVTPEVYLNGIEQEQIIDGPISLIPDVNFVADYVKYEITNLDNGQVYLTSESDPYGPYNWSPMVHESGAYSFKVLAYSDNQSYESESINAKIQISHSLKLTGVPSSKTIDKLITLSSARNFHVSETQYVLRDLNSGKETVLAKMGYGSYKWFPGPEHAGMKELLVRVKDTKGVVYESESIEVNVLGMPQIMLNGVGPNQVITGDFKLKTISNVSLGKVNYILTNLKTGTKKVLASNQSPNFEYTYTPVLEDEGEWTIQAEGYLDTGKKLVSEKIPVTIYLGETYSSQPIIEKHKFLGLASELARSSWEKTGMSAALQTAQAILETGWGQSVPVDKYNGQLSNNLFGIKGTGTAGSVISNTWEVYNGVSFRVDAEFRAYNNVNESWDDHKALLLTKERYAPFREVMHDSTLGAWAIRRAGYATDPQYPLKLISIISKYNLYILDEISI